MRIARTRICRWKTPHRAWLLLTATVLWLPSCTQSRDLVTVDAVCGNEACELGESHETCPADCEYHSGDALPIAGRLKVLPSPIVAFPSPTDPGIHAVVNLVNAGQDPVTVDAVEYVGGSDFVVAIDDIFPTTLHDHSGWRGITVQYVGDPSSAAEAYGELHVTTSDLTSPSQAIPIYASTADAPHEEYTSGEGDVLYSYIEMTPDPIVVQAPALNDSVDFSVSIAPQGWIPAAVQWVEVDHPDFEQLREPTYPFTTTTTVSLRYTPTTNIPASTRLIVEYTTCTGYLVALETPILIR